MIKFSKVKICRLSLKPYLNNEKVRSTSQDVAGASYTLGEKLFTVRNRLCRLLAKLQILCEE